MKKSNKDYKSKWDADEILFKVSVTEVFVLNGKEVMCSDNNGEKNKLYEDYTEDYLMFMAILKIAKDYALEKGEVEEYPVYDSLEHRNEVRRRDKDFVFQLLKDREHGKEVGDKAIVTKIAERLIKVEYDGKRATLRWVGNHPFLEILRTNEEWRIER